MFEAVKRQVPLDMIIYDDSCPTNGFILLPDRAWDGTDKNIYLLAIVNQKGIKSLRDLNQTHLPLLENILWSGSVSCLINFMKIN